MDEACWISQSAMERLPKLIASEPDHALAYQSCWTLSKWESGSREFEVGFMGKRRCELHQHKKGVKKTLKKQARKANEMTVAGSYALWRLIVTGRQILVRRRKMNCRRFIIFW